MASKPFEFTISDTWGNLVDFHDTNELREFLEAERANWAWVADASHQPGPNMIDGFWDNYRAVFDWVANYEESRSDEHELHANLQGIYGRKNPGLIFSEFSPGEIVSAIRQELGVDQGERALALITGRAQPNLQEISDFRLWTRLAIPSSLAGEAWTDDLRQKVAKTRESLRAEIRAHRHNMESIEGRWHRKNLGDRRRYLRLVKKVLSAGRDQARAIAHNAQNEIAAMKDLQSAYQEQMRLMAPVEYWSAKGKAHSVSAGNWGSALGWYVAGAIGVAGWGFHQAWSALDSDEKLTSRHFLLVAMIGAALTLLFWGARLIVRIYLGERHLHTDAEERRIMTQAYLALIKEGAATDQERMLILSALFRNASDGIVKDDGAGDISLPAMIAKLLDAKK